MQQPKSIERFEQLFFLSMVISIGITILGLGTNATQMANSPIGSAAKFATIAVLVLSCAVWGLLWYLIARRGSEIAKWFYVVLIAIEVVMTTGSMLLLKAMEGRPDIQIPKVDMTTQIGQVASILVGVVSIWFLFRPDTRAWFNKGVDPNA